MRFLCVFVILYYQYTQPHVFIKLGVTQSPRCPQVFFKGTVTFLAVHDSLDKDLKIYIFTHNFYA